MSGKPKRAWITGGTTHQVIQKKKGVHHVHFTADGSTYNEPRPFSLPMGRHDPHGCAGARAAACGRAGNFFGLRAWGHVSNQGVHYVLTTTTTPHAPFQTWLHALVSMTCQ